MWLCGYNIPVETNPSCLHTTTASMLPQESSQTVPHTLLLQISTRPSVIAVPPTSRKAPFVVELHVWAAAKIMIMNTICIILHNIHSIANYSHESNGRHLCMHTLHSHGHSHHGKTWPLRLAISWYHGVVNQLGRQKLSPLKLWRTHPCYIHYIYELRYYCATMLMHTCMYKHRGVGEGA